MKVEEMKRRLEDKIERVHEEIKETEERLINLYAELKSLNDKKYMLDPNLVKINCVGCGGTGYITSKSDGKKIVCNICGGSGYNWAKKWSP